ncbi:MAG: bifunctional oligoribonuclease/PAP phosphatase NrnA [Acidobacteriota bacterium]
MRSSPEACLRVCEALRRYDRFVVTSHVRPDGDSVGSALALASALNAIGKQARVINRDRAPAPLCEFPGVARIELGEEAGDGIDAVVVLECGDLERTGLRGLDRVPLINVDHHPGNTGYGEVQWFDGTAAACGEMVYDIVTELGAPITPDMATQLFVAIVTDTGSFRYPGVSPRTFRTCARLLEAGADPVLTARRLFDSNTIGRLRLQGAVLQAMEIHESGQIALLYLADAALASTGGTLEETDGLINLPLSVKAIRAVAFFKQAEDGQYRVSLRSKGDIDVGRVARGFGGGGHRNAAGCTLAGTLATVRSRVLEPLVPEVTGSRGPLPAVTHRD